MVISQNLTYEHRQIVEAHHLASALGSGGAPVFGTPALLALCEAAAFLCVAPHLEAGQSTVGTLVELRHFAATPLGAEVHAVATLTEIEGRTLRFTIEAFDQWEKIGECRHERAIVDERRFLERVGRKQ